MLRAASTSYEATRAELENLIYELKVAMFLTGARTLADLAKAPYVVLGETRQWLER